MTCPAGNVVSLSAKGNARFELHCRGCRMRDRCTRSARGKTIKLSPHDRELVEARRARRAGEIADVYRQQRPMVERTIAWLTRGTNRKLRYRGVERNQLWLATRVAAINLRRLVNLGLRAEGGGWALQRA